MADIKKTLIKNKVQSPDQLDKQVVVMRPPYWIAIIGAIILIVIFAIWGFTAKLPEIENYNGIYISGGEAVTVYSDEYGIIKDVYKASGDMVKKGDCIATFEDGTSVNASASGKIVETDATSGMYIDDGDAIAIIRKTDEEASKWNAVFCVSADEVTKLSKGMKVIASPEGIDENKYGTISGKILYISKESVSRARMMIIVGDESILDKMCGSNNSMYMVYCTFEKDPDSVSGFHFSGKYGDEAKLSDSSMMNLSVTVSEKTPVDLFFGN